MNKLGCHISFSKKNNYLPGAIEIGLSFGCNTIMIFMGPPHTSKRVDISSFNKEIYYESNLSSKILPHDIVAHGPYIINPANESKMQFAKDFLVSEMKRLDYIGGKYFVLHPGSNINKELGIENCAEVIKYALSQVPNISIAIETMSGKGNEIGSKFEELKSIIDIVDNKRVGVCMDTCHIWDAGYDISNFDKILDKFDEIIGLDNLFVIHLNDSKNKLNSHKDRHANIGEGYIGLKTCKSINQNPRIQNVNKILETPWVDGQPIYKKEILLLNSK